MTKRFRGNVGASVTPLGATNIYGEREGGTPRSALVSVVRLTTATTPTSTVDQESGTQGRAGEILPDAILLFAPGDPIALAERVTVSGVTLEVTGIQQRFDVRGVLNHLEVSLAGRAA